MRGGSRPGSLRERGCRLAALLITFREGLEAALIVGILLGYVRRVTVRGAYRPIWLGVVAALLVSILVGAALQLLGAELEGRGEQFFEGCTMVLASAVLTYMVLWMRTQGREMRSDLEARLGRAAPGALRRAIFTVAFVAVVREGIETALFLGAAAFAAASLQTLIGGLLGLALAVAAGYLLYVGSSRLNLRAFFNVTGVLLIAFAAGLLASAVHEFQEAGVLPTLIAQLWDLSPIVPKSGVLGALLNALLGYNPSPSLVEALTYMLYWVVQVLVYRRVGRAPSGAPRV